MKFHYKNALLPDEQSTEGIRGGSLELFDIPSQGKRPVPCEVLHDLRQETGPGSVTVSRSPNAGR